MGIAERDLNLHALREAVAVRDIASDAINVEDVLLRIMENEGFVGKPYPDPSGQNWSAGYGTNLTRISRREGALLLLLRLSEMLSELAQRVHAEYEFDLDSLPNSVQGALADMVYAHGVPRLMLYKKMWAALKVRDWQEAAEQALDSRWGRTYVTRAGRAARLIRAASARWDLG